MIWAHLDRWGHRLRVPRFLMQPICDMYDLSLGMYPEQIAPDYPDGPPWWLRLALRRTA